MNEQLQKEIAAWLATIRTGVESAGNFVIEQAPLVVQEKVAWGRAEETVWLVVMLGLFAFTVFKLLPIVRAWAVQQAKASDGFSYFLAVIAHVLTVAPLGTLTMLQLSDTLKVWLAPRLYIIDWLASLVQVAQK